MDYEKKYKEALERMRYVVIEPKNENMLQAIKETVFPELKESEDERIRKWLIGYFHQYKNDGMEQYTNGLKVDDIIAWLEKQGESYTKRDVDDAYVEGMAFAKDELEKQGEPSIKWNKNTEGNKPQVNHSVLMKTTQGIAEGEWQGEQWFQYRWASIVRDSDVLSWMELSDLEKQGEKESAWSEEDERMCQETIDWFEKKCFPYALESENPARESIKWLKSLKDRTFPQPKQEWSEEDEKIFVNLISYGSLKYTGEQVIDWLNSLKQRIGG